jgi:hypothetical protein
MIKLFPIGVFQIEPGETPETIRQSLQSCWGLHFTSAIQEMKTGRTLPPDEIIVDNREYWINFTSIPT